MVLVVIVLVCFMVMIGRVMFMIRSGMIRFGVSDFGRVVVIRIRGVIVLGRLWRFGWFLGMIVQQIKAFDIDEHGPIVWCAGRR